MNSIMDIKQLRDWGCLDNSCLQDHFCSLWRFPWWGYMWERFAVTPCILSWESDRGHEHEWALFRATIKIIFVVYEGFHGEDTCERGLRVKPCILSWESDRGHEHEWALFRATIKIIFVVFAGFHGEDTMWAEVCGYNHVFFLERVIVGMSMSWALFWAQDSFLLLAIKPYNVESLSKIIISRSVFPKRVMIYRVAHKKRNSRYSQFQDFAKWSIEL